MEDEKDVACDTWNLGKERKRKKKKKERKDVRT